MNKLMTGTLALILGFVATSNTAEASALTSYWDFTKITADGANNVTDTFGNMTGTLKSTATTLSASGLTIGAGAGADTGVTVAGSQLSSFTGDFTLQIWFDRSVAGGNKALFGGTTSATVDGNMTGDQALFAGYNSNGTFLRPIVSNNTRYGTEINPTAGVAGTLNTLYDFTLTYTAATHTFQSYVDGVAVGTGASVTYFTGLDALSNGFSIGGVQTPAFGDGAAEVNISSFLFYDGALTSTEVATINGFGSGATVDQLGTVVSIPEPSTIGLFGVFGAGIVFARRRRRVM